VKQDRRPKKFYRIGEVSKLTGVGPHVLRYWESALQIVNPNRKLSKQRLYQQSDIDLILEIKRLLHEERYTLSGVKQCLDQRCSPSGRHLPAHTELDSESALPEVELRELLNLVRVELKAIQKILC
jgi:DNA-binding transcriptional MerR regulator